MHHVAGDRFAGIDADADADAAADDGEGRAVLLDGGVLARIVVGPDTVVWSDFWARGRPRLPDGLHFTFDRAEYEAALAATPGPWG